MQQVVVRDVKLWPVLLAGIIALATAMGIGRFVYTPILPIMASGLDLGPSASGLIASWNFAGYLAGALLAATPWLRGNRKMWVVSGLIMSAITTFMMGLFDAEPIFWLLRFVGGAASAFVLVYCSAAVISVVSSSGHQGYATVHFAGVGIGIALSAVLVASAANIGADWYHQWYLAGAVSLIGALLVAKLLPADDKIQGSAQTGSIDWSMLPLITAYGLFGFGYVITATFIVALARGSEVLLPIEPWIWLIAGLAGAPSVALWSWIATRIGLLPAFSLACLVEAVGVALSVTVISITGLVLAAIFLGGTFMGITALGLMAARQSRAGDPSRMLALMTASFGLGQIIGPGFAGWLAERTGSFHLPSMTAAGALLLAASLVFFIQRSSSHNSTLDQT